MEKDTHTVIPPPTPPFWCPAVLDVQTHTHLCARLGVIPESSVVDILSEPRPVVRCDNVNLLTKWPWPFRLVSTQKSHIFDPVSLHLTTLPAPLLLLGNVC